jgi:dUTP pyrophosphatase
MKEVRVKIVNKSKNLLPFYAEEGDSGMDIRSNEKRIIWMGKTEIISTGIYVEIPKGYEIQIRSRSGMTAIHGIFVLNSPGTIDSQYRGEIKVILHNAGEMSYEIREGERIAQLVLQKVPQIRWEPTNKLSKTKRDKSGFGSTGKI